jgi:hypothetical protein
MNEKTVFDQLGRYCKDFLAGNGSTGEFVDNVHGLFVDDSLLDWEFQPDAARRLARAIVREISAG